MSFFTLFVLRCLLLSCGECDVISLHFMCCSVIDAFVLCVACLTEFVNGLVKQFAICLVLCVACLTEFVNCLMKQCGVVVIC